MKRRTRWFLIGIAFTLGLITLSAQIRPNPQTPGRDRIGARGSEENAASARTPIADAAAMQSRDGSALRLAVHARTAVRAWDERVQQMEQTEELRTRKIQEDTQLPGRVHQRLVQYYSGVPVFGGEIVRQSDQHGTLTIDGTLYPEIAMDVTPTLSRAAAIGIFERETGETASPTLLPQLVILPKDDGTFVLTYRVSQFAGNEMPVLFVNANNGAVEFRYNNLQTQAVVFRGTGVLGDDKKVSGLLQNGLYMASDRMRPPVLDTFDLRGNLTRTKAILFYGTQASTSDIASHAEDHWTDGAAVDAHTYLGWTYDYYYKRFGRRGLDGHDTPMRAIVHPARPEDMWMSSSDYGTYVLNAFWCGGCGVDGRGYMVFGDGLPSGYYMVATGQHWEPVAGALDVVAHELTHGLTDYTSGLIYSKESGALNEAFSDVLGTGAEFFFQSSGSGSQHADYLIAEDVVVPFIRGSKNGLRSMADPSAFGDRDHYSKRYTGSSDDGGVHTNSGIANNAFYLAIEGGTNRTSGLSVQGVGASNRAQIEQVFYRAFVYYLTPNANFSAARSATIRAAQELYGTGSPADRAITQAWTAVGVF